MKTKFLISSILSFSLLNGNMINYQEIENNKDKLMNDPAYKQEYVRIKTEEATNNYKNNLKAMTGIDIEGGITAKGVHTDSDKTNNNLVSNKRGNFNDSPNYRIISYNNQKGMGGGYPISNKNLNNSTRSKVDYIKNHMKSQTGDSSDGNILGSNAFSFPNQATGALATPVPAQQVITGTPSKDSNINSALATMIANSKDIETTYEVLDKTLSDKEELEKKISRRNSDINIQDRSVYINYQDKSHPTKIKLKRGYITQIDFYNESGSPISISQYTIGNRIANITLPFKNQIGIEPTANYRKTILTVRLDGYQNPFSFEIEESAKNQENVVDNFVKVVVSDSDLNQRSMDQQGLKMNILKELYKYGTLRGEYAKQISYRTYDLSKNATDVRYFEDKDLKIFRVIKGGYEFLVVQLSNQFEILGLSNKEFSRYQNAYNIYFLPFTQGSFDLIKKLDKKSDVLSDPTYFDTDLGLGELYEIRILE